MSEVESVEQCLGWRANKFSPVLLVIATAGIGILGVDFFIR